MAILTKARLTSLTESRLGTRMFSEVINEAKRENKAFATTSIFLSHSHDDLTEGNVDKAIAFLRKRGVRVYIDSHDSSLPPFTNAQTANQIKQRIRDMSKFILLATTKSINSKWCNWELGYGDAHKYIRRIALLPIAEDNGTFTGAEYLRIYPRIEETYVGSEVYNVYYPDGTVQSITEWLNN